LTETFCLSTKTFSLTENNVVKCVQASEDDWWRLPDSVTGGGSRVVFDDRPAAETLNKFHN